MFFSEDAGKVRDYFQDLYLFRLEKAKKSKLEVDFTDCWTWPTKRTVLEGGIQLDYYDIQQHWMMQQDNMQSNTGKRHIWTT